MKTPRQVAEETALDVAARYPDVQPRVEFELALLTATLDTATELCRSDGGYLPCVEPGETR